MAAESEDGRLDELVHAALSASCGIINVRDDVGDPSDAFAFLSNGVRDLAVRRTASAARDCAERFETVATWLAPADPNRAVLLNTLAGRLREFTTPH